MSLLEAVTNVANEAGYAVDSAVIGSNDVTTKQLLAIAQRINRDMAIAYPWAKFFASGSITLVDGESLYELPAAFSSYHYDSFWNSSTRWRVIGPMTEQEYAQTRGYGLNTAIYQRFQLRGIANDQLLIYPTPGSANDGDIIIFEYIAARSVRPATWAAGNFLEGEYTFSDGNYYTADADFTSSIEPTHTSGTANGFTYYSGAYEKFLADDDESILPQGVLEQGMLERFAEIHGIEGVIQGRYLDQLNEEFSKESPGKVIYAGNERGKAMQARSNVVVFGSWI